jgi:exoribonuclease-2
MESGNVVEYIDRQNIVCAVILEVKKQRLRLLTENNREVNLSSSRLSHKCAMRLDSSQGRQKMVKTLKEIASRRKELISRIDIKELWEVLNTEQQWIDLATMTEFCFPDRPTDDHEAAVVRAFFANRFYFKFNPDRFFPNSEEQVDRFVTLEKEIARRNRIIKEGADWLKSLLNNADDISEPPAEGKQEFAEILKSAYLFEKESKHYNLAKTIVTNAGINAIEDIFPVFVKVGIWDVNENIDLKRFEIPTNFYNHVVEKATALINSPIGSPAVISADSQRQNLTAIPLITIDGQATLDYDDAISIESTGNGYQLGIHIVDVGHFIKKGDIIDREASTRGSSIYMPDRKIPMLPSCLAEDLCSLKIGKLRPAISTVVQLNSSFDIIDYEIVPSLIKVNHQYTYYDVNLMGDTNEEIVILQKIALKFRKQRLEAGAVQISLPELNVWIDADGEIVVNKINRESPGRMLVSELMIMANWLMAKFLIKHDVPAIFRTQPSPKERLYKGNEGNLFQNIMQRRLLSRFILNHEADHHSGLGLEAYTTATSPIRKYFDLVTQRQIRAALGLETPYSSEEIDHIMNLLEQPISNVMRLQQKRSRYWVLKFLEQRIGQKEEAIVLLKRRKSYQVLLPEYMMECELPISGGIDLNPEDLIQVTIQHVNARKDLLAVFGG